VDFQEEMSQAVRLVHEDLTLLSKAVREAALWLRNSSSRRAAEPGKQKRGGDKDTKNHSNATNSSGNSSGRLGEQADADEYHQDVGSDVDDPVEVVVHKRRKRRRRGWTPSTGEGRLAAPLIPQDSHDALLSRHAKQPDIERETAVQKAENLSSAPNDTTTKSHTAHSKHPMRTGHKHRHSRQRDATKIQDAQADATHTEKTKEPREVEQEKLRAKYNMQVTPTGSSMPFQVGKPGA